MDAGGEGGYGANIVQRKAEMRRHGMGRDGTTFSDC